MSPAEFGALAEADQARLEIEMFPVLQLTATYINSHLKENSKAVSPADLSPFRHAPRRISGAQFLKHLESLKP